ncbi:MAG: ribose 5-phosphate isomerase B [Desulfobulbaceae bacterium]|uniref:Ribose 5-phosphate isomerase B n=1 Tax=Candidatus Desulfatifera sulfidica TaxID=2841691 RepID=A0A8J6TBV2_9BACT|nr:ribose 5-phosphate isomerase B [Candidatus Desulfatifera sulfidica]
MKIAIGADHGGYQLKEKIVAQLIELGHEVEDVGCFGPESVNYPDYASQVCERIEGAQAQRGILICGTGLGMSMAANRYPHVRAALCHESFSARLSREHNNANVLCLGERVTGTELAADIVTVWLATEFAGGRHQSRIEKFSQC